MSERLAAVEFARVVYKCKSKSHITLEEDLAYHKHLISGTPEKPAKPKPELDHEGCEVRTVFIVPGSAPIAHEPCSKCGEPMVAMGPEPRYVTLSCDENGFVDHDELVAEVLKAQRPGAELGMPARTEPKC
jgi:hypothetical protein